MYRDVLDAVRPAIAVTVAVAAACLLGTAPAAATPYIYVANSGSDTVTPFLAGSDLLSDHDAPVPTGSTPLGAAGTPDGHYVYVALNGDDAVDAFAVQSHGELEHVAGAPFAAGINPVVPAVSPDGANLYVANFGSDTISAYDIGVDGTPTPLAGPPATTADGPQQISFTPDGNHAYVPNFGSGSVSGFDVGADGALTPMAGSPFPAGSFPNNSEVTPNGKFLYVSNRMSNNVSAFAIGVDGTLTAVPGSPFATGGTMPNGLTAFEGAESDFLFVAATGSNLVVRFAIGADGALTSIGTTPVGGGPVAVQNGNRDNALLVVNGTTNDVSTAFINPDGTLDPPAKSPYATGGTSPIGKSIAVLDSDDRAALQVQAAHVQKQKGEKVKVKFSVKAAEPLLVKASGVITARGLKHPPKLKKVSADLGAGASRPFTIKLKKKSKNAAIFARVAKGKQAKASFYVTGTDALGNIDGPHVKVLLK